MSDATFARDQSQEPTWAWWLLLALGLICVAAGVIVLAKPGDSLAALAVIVGVFMLVDGIFELGLSLSRHTESRGLTALVGVLNAVVGVVLVRHPIAGVTAVALFIGIWLVALGVVRFIAAFETRAHRLWNVAVAAIEVIAGVVILANPDIGYATLALFVGLGFILRGVAICALGWALHVVRRDLAVAERHAGATA